MLVPRRLESSGSVTLRMQFTSYRPGSRLGSDAVLFCFVVEDLVVGGFLSWKTLRVSTQSLLPVSLWFHG